MSEIATIQEQVPEVWLAIAGKGPLRDDLEQQVHQLGLSDRVNLVGYLPDEQLPMAYQAADLTVIPSQALEGFGLIILESLASGTPVLTTPVGGMPEILQPFTPDLITATPEKDAIADSLIQLLTGKISMPSRQECYSYAFEHFNWPDIAARIRIVLLQNNPSS